MAKNPSDEPMQRHLGVRSGTMGERKVVHGSQQPFGERAQQPVANPPKPDAPKLQTKPQPKD